MYRALFLLILLSVLPLSARPYVLLFGSANCDQCAELKAIWEQREFTAKSPVLIYISIDSDANYAYLKRLERALKISNPGASFPIMLVGNQMVAGTDGFISVALELNTLLRRTPKHPILAPLQKAADGAQSGIISWDYAPPQAPTTQAPPPPAPANQPVRLLYLSNPGCQKCARQEKELSLLKEKSLPNLVVDKYEVTTTEGQIMLRRVVSHFQLDPGIKNLAPIVVWNEGNIYDRLAEADELAAALAKTTGAPFWSAPITDEERQTQAAAEKNFLSQATWLTAIIGGAIDGINPCAFATAIFLISYLLLKKRSRNYILAIGTAFCCGVFLSYFAFGVGLSFLVDWLAKFTIVRQILYGIFALAGLVLAALHLRDAFRYRKSGKATDMDMGLNVQTHRDIHNKIHRWTALSSWLAIPCAILLGVIISSMEFVCTGQVYLPMLMAINANGFDGQALLLLLLYNLAFIVPLLAVTLLAYYGVGAQALSKWAKNHLFATKIAMAALFLALAALMLLAA